jgi:TPR repeat protein
MLAGQVLIYDCQLKQAASCKRMGYLGLHGGYGATKAPEHGFAMMKEACFLGDGEACWACGSEIENGVNMGKRPDKKAAKYWYKRACSQGYQSGKDLRGRPVCKNR